ncbi:MAG: hypothetical protein KJ626_03190, partial [Verrucomicrobia bacterium]|nr:hypothetical protein [Verrucomicrobiota bacterium]
KGGDAALAAFIADLQSLGWSVALSQNYKGLSPLNVRWNEDDVELDESGQWRGSSPGHYVLKAQRAIEWQRELLPEIRKKYGPDASFVGSRTLSPLWEAVDCDARVPQSGILSQNYYLYGELFLRERAGVDGPVVGGGAGAWPFAGLLDGYIAPSETSPFMVLHELNGIHSMACVIGAGERMDDQDRYLAIEIANGRCGMLWGEAGVRAALRGYYMMQALQCLYALKTPEQISYFDGSRLLPVSQAIAVGASRKNMLYVRYPGDIEIWVNGSTDRMWDVKVGRRTWDIPPSGWVASGPNFIELSCITDGARIDYVESPGYVYFDPRGIESEFRGLRTAAPLVVRRGKRGGGEYEVTTTPDSTGFSIDREWLPAGNVRCRTFDVEGVEVSPSVLEVDSEWIKVTPTRGGIRHILDMGGGDS